MTASGSDSAVVRPLSGTSPNRRFCLGLCDACPYAPACALILPSRAGVAQAPMEETAAYFAAVAKAMGFECSAARSRRRYYHRAVTGVVSMLAVGRAASRFMMALLASHDVSAAHDTVVRYRNLATESGRRRDHHAAARNGGGPRIDCPRAKASTTHIAAPQCGQAKVGGTIVVEARLHDGASTAAMTSSS